MIKVLVCDDSILMRKVLMDMLSDVEGLKVIGEASDGEEVVEKVKKLKPDVVLLDYEMPKLNGIEALKRIMEENPVPVIMFSSYTREGSYVALKSLELGAFDYVLKPCLKSDESAWEKVKESLVKKIFSAAGVDINILKRRYFPHIFGEVYSGDMVCAVGIGASTGGPKIIKYILSSLPLMAVSIFIVQHMPAVFSEYFREYLQGGVKWRVKIPEEGEKVQKGMVYVAKGGLHMRVLKGVIHYDDSPPVNSVRPSIDILFESLADEYRERCIGVILTGMGRDGGMGAMKIYEYGGKIIVQKFDTCVVKSMPLYAKELVKNVKILAPEDIPKEIVALCQKRKS